MSLYAKNNGGEQRKWKEKIRKRFREEIQSWLQQDFEFYAIKPRPTVNVKTYIETHFRQVLGKVYTPFDEEDIFSLALEKSDVKNNEELLAELAKAFYVSPCSLGTNPNEVLSAVDTNSSQVSTENGKEKKVFTCLVRKTDDSFKAFAEHRGKTYIMERIPAINLMGIKYLLPMVGGMIDGYYDVQRIAIAEHDGKAALRIRLGEYHSLGTEWVQIYRTKMQPGELISMDYTVNMYTKTI